MERSSWITRRQDLLRPAHWTQRTAIGLSLLLPLLLTYTLVMFYTLEPPNHTVDIIAASDVIMYRGEPEHLGLAAADATAGDGYFRDWISKRLNAAAYSASKSTPAVVGEMIFIGTDRGTLTAVSRSDGIVVWEFGTRDSQNGIHGSPAVDAEKVYVGAYDGWIYAIWRSNGTLAWENKLGDYIGSSPTLYNGSAFIGVEMATPAGFVVGVNLTTGAEIFRSHRLGNHPHGTPTIDTQTDLLYIGANDWNFYCYDLANSTLLEPDLEWVFTMGEYNNNDEMTGDIKSTAAVSGGIVYITSWDWHVYALDQFSGEEIWRYRFESRSMSSPSVDASRGLLVVGSHDHKVVGLDLLNGELRWELGTGGAILSSATLLEHEGLGIIGSRDGSAYLFSLEGGAVEQRLYLESGLTAVPVLSGPHLYLFDHLGYLYSFTST